MSTSLEIAARNHLKEQLDGLTPKNKEMIRLIYGRAGGKRSVQEAKEMPLDQVIDEIPYDKLPVLQGQIDRTLKRHPE